MKLVELLVMLETLFKTFLKQNIKNNKNIIRDLMDDVISIKLNVNNDDGYYYLIIYCNNHTNHYKVPKISDDILKKLRKNVHKICENSSDEIVNKDLHINIKIEDDEY